MIMLLYDKSQMPQMYFYWMQLTLRLRHDGWKLKLYKNLKVMFGKYSEFPRMVRALEYHLNQVLKTAETTEKGMLFLKIQWQLILQ